MLFAACGEGLDTDYTDDGYRYMLWVAKTGVAEIEGLEFRPEDRKLEDRRNYSDAGYTMPPTDLAIPSTQEGLAVINGDTSTQQIAMWRITAKGSALQYVVARGLQPGSTPKQVIFTDAYSSNPQVLLQNGATVDLMGVPFDWTTGQVNAPSGLTSVTVSDPGQIAKVNNTSSFVLTHRTGSARSIALGGGFPSTPYTSIVMNNSDALATGRNSQMIAAVSGSGSITVYDTDGNDTPNSVVGIGPTAQADVRLLATDPSRSILVSVGIESNGVGTARVYGYDDLVNARTELDRETVGNDPRRMVFDPSGQLLAISDQNGNRVYVFKVDTGRTGNRILTRMRGSPYTVTDGPRGLAWSRIWKR